MSDNPPVPPAPEPGAYPPPPPGYSAPPSGYAAAPPPYGAAPQQPYATAPQYGAAQGYGYGAPTKTNTLAIVSLVASLASFIIVPLIGSVVGVITGHMALNQLKTSGEEGRGLALAGTIVGWVGLGLTIFGIIALIAFFGFVASVTPGYSY